eukprot:TRINITY_DN15524_c0_g1_i1.p1 TRINITY_DN15524_c0_g1~~TRINITY_DN15524_c0_g1_i1.p1  ORF type:complete len:288 (+),score=64.36 TRINITY_DN15524_c0_g1_i1:50-865(+)
MAATRLLFLEDTYLFKVTGARVLSVLSVAATTQPTSSSSSSSPVSTSAPTSVETKKKHVILLDKTIFHPQGGGQPFDTGFILGKDNRFAVTEVRQKGDEVQHIGTFENEANEFQEGDEVDLEINESDRRLYARLHSAGHLLDVAIRNVGQTQLVPGKGYHFPAGPFVEYIGSIDAKERETVRKNLELEINKLVKEGAEVEVKTAHGADQIKEYCGSVPDYISTEKPCRVVFIKEGCPCGGTHVKNTAEIGGVVVPKITVKKNVSRVSYRLV